MAGIKGFLSTSLPYRNINSKLQDPVYIMCFTINTINIFGNIYNAICHSGLDGKIAQGLVQNNEDDKPAENADSADHNQKSRIKKS